MAELSSKGPRGPNTGNCTLAYTLIVGDCPDFLACCKEPTGAFLSVTNFVGTDFAEGRTHLGGGRAKGTLFR